jgi:hypothetical protein
MKTVRLGDQLEARVDKIARKTGQSVSQVIRDAVERHCDALAGQTAYDRLADVIGAGSSCGGNARNSGQEFADHLLKKHEARQSRAPRRGRNK